MRSLAILTCLFAIARLAAAAEFPAPVSLPSFPLAGALEESRHAEVEFPGRGEKVVVQGRIWRGEVEYAARHSEPKAALAAIVEEMKRGGWEVMMRDDPASPPMASFRLTKEGKDYWALVSVLERARVTLLAVGPSPAKNRFQKPSDRRGP